MDFLAPFYHTIITGAIFVLGVATVWLSVYACIKFHQFRTDLTNNASTLSRAIGFQLAGEAVIGAGTLVFASAEFLGVLKNWDYYFTSALRFTMFAATSITTYHLVHVLENLKKER